MPDLIVTVVIPTLAADSRLVDCIESLERQTRRDFEAIIVDNSGEGLVRRKGLARGARIIENPRNAGFGAAVNQGWRVSTAPCLATLNDDAVAHPGWLEALVAAMERHPEAGMCASQVRLFGEDCLDSAGMLVARDGRLPVAGASTQLCASDGCARRPNASSPIAPGAVGPNVTIVDVHTTR